MICVVQRVSSAWVLVEGREVGRIDRGMVVLLAVHATDGDAEIAWMTGKLATLRIFPQGERNFDLDVQQIGGAILLISNFTVAADAQKGRRPSLAAAADPAVARDRFDRLVQGLRDARINVQTGQFGADMQVTLTNDGPVTFLLDSRIKQD
ncbi:MAG: D-aminoacyl-tRNA deacylase [Tepidisphaeraceae bacterium]|jgi:D-tyrosyl-tRNA(Tyr) deacylase